MPAFISQIVALLEFNLRSLPARTGSVISGAVGIAGVVGVLVGVLSIATGFRATMTVKGPADVALVLRSGSDTELVSGLSLEETRIIADAPGLARSGNSPLSAAELLVIINLPQRATGTDANIPLRGIGTTSMDVRGNIKIVEGRAIETGRNEVIVGQGAALAFAGLDVGNDIKVGANLWKVVGRFTADGGIAESEIWTDAPVLQAAYQRGSSFQSVIARLQSPGAFDQFEKALSEDPRLNVRTMRQADYFASQSIATTALIVTLGGLIAGLMSLGAIFGALNTMYASVASRSREIATLRALGFGRSPILAAVMLESLAIALLGGAVGALAAWLALDGYRASTINFQSFSQVAFAFQVSPLLLFLGVLCAACIGVCGGFFPALRAARLPIAAALRDS